MADDWTFQICDVLDAGWVFEPATAVGGDSGPADLFVLAERAGARRRFDLRYRELDYRHGPQAIFWRGWFCFGFGGRAILLREDGGAPVAVDLDCYLSDFVAGDDYLLAVSGQGIVRLDPGGHIVWRNDALGVDGVIVFDIEDGIIDGQGEWDPPGGWRDFLVSLETGESLPLDDDDAEDESDA